MSKRTGLISVYCLVPSNVSYPVNLTYWCFFCEIVIVGKQVEYKNWGVMSSTRQNNPRIECLLDSWSVNTILESTNIKAFLNSSNAYTFLDSTNACTFLDSSRVCTILESRNAIIMPSSIPGMWIPSWNRPIWQHKSDIHSSIRPGYIPSKNQGMQFHIARCQEFWYLFDNYLWTQKFLERGNLTSLPLI